MPKVINNQDKKKEEFKPKLWLLFIGVSHYQDHQNLATLPYANADCEQLAIAFQETNEKLFPESNQKKVFIYHNETKEKPEITTIRNTLKSITELAHYRDRIVFYFCGHGLLDQKTKQSFFCLTDTNVNNLNTALSTSELLQYLGNCQAKEQIIILDACHSGGLRLQNRFQEKLSNGKFYQAFNNYQKNAKENEFFCCFLSCNEDEESLEFKDLEHGLFTYYFLEALKGECANSQGEIHAYQLYQSLKNNSWKKIDQQNQQNQIINQTARGRNLNQIEDKYIFPHPRLICDLAGDVIIGHEIKNDIQPQRAALIIDGLSLEVETLELIKILRQKGRFQDIYHWQKDNDNLPNIYELIPHYLSLHSSVTSQEKYTVLLYLRGKITNINDHEYFELNNGEKLDFVWLKQQLETSTASQQIVILDCPTNSSILEWVDQLNTERELGQCLMAAASPKLQENAFLKILVSAL